MNQAASIWQIEKNSEELYGKMTVIGRGSKEQRSYTRQKSRLSYYLVYFPIGNARGLSGRLLTPNDTVIPDFLVFNYISGEDKPATISTGGFCRN